MGLARFVAFHECPEEGAMPAPLAFAVMIPRNPQGVLLVFSRIRQVWELPGGLIDPGELPRQAAERELVEEAGCAARQTRWLGVVEVNDGKPHFGAVFDCETGPVPAVFENAETVAIGFWSRGDAAMNPLGHSDAALLERFG
jgi:8-oxo-dGTP diphosphatase